MVAKTPPPAFKKQSVQGGEIFIKQGEEGRFAYLIQSGAVSVYTVNDGKKVEIARLATGQIIGEMALISKAPRAASVMAIQDTELIVLTPELFKDKLERSDPTVRAMVEMMTRRIALSNKEFIRNVAEQAEHDAINDMMEAVRLLYQNALTAMPEDKREGFSDAVLDQLDDFLKSVRDFIINH